jgi:glycosyltransferase involved in cell wall biosynthesis
MPRISVLLPSYRHAAYLEECLSSVRAQTIEDWELIAIDDAGPDQSYEILRQFSGRDARITADRNEVNLGTYGTLERARERARAPLLAVLNSDDVWRPEKLAEMVQALEAAPDAPLAYHAGEGLGDAQGLNLHAAWPTTFRQDLRPFLVAENRVLASATVFRAEHCRFDPELRYSGDWWALFGAAQHGEFAFVDKPLSQWRVHGRSTHRRSVPQMAEEVKVRLRILDRSVRARYPGPAARSLAAVSALLVYFDLFVDAREAAGMALRLSPSVASLRRYASIAWTNPVAVKRRFYPDFSDLYASEVRDEVAELWRSYKGER